jgi:NAD(P)-dependent dehydrogenase (short-subunit alcohol dehydrogenase family)
MALDGSMAGKRVVLTGGTDGIGKAAAIQLLELGADLTLMARDAAKAERAVAEIRAKSAVHAAIDVIAGDLSSLDAVRTFARAVSTRSARVDVLLNNAGLYNARRMETVDGYEMMLATNHLGPFLLTLELLTGALRAPARIAFTESFAERFSGVRFDDLQSMQSYRPLAVYGRSKRANLLCVYALARKLVGTGIAVNAWHPGFVRTNIEGNRENPVFRAFTAFATTPHQAARTLVYLASSPELERVTGAYFANRRRARSSRGSHSPVDQERMWRSSVELTRAPELRVPAA